MSLAALVKAMADEGMSAHDIAKVVARMEESRKEKLAPEMRNVNVASKQEKVTQITLLTMITPLLEVFPLQMGLARKLPARPLIRIPHYVRDY